LQRRFFNGKNQAQAAPEELPNCFKESKPGPNVLLKREFHNTGRYPNPPCLNPPWNMLKMVMNYKYLGIACCMSIVCFGKYLPMEHTISCKHIKPLCLCSSKEETWINDNLYIMNNYLF